MTQSQPRQKLPPETEDSVVEVELRHVVLAFTAVVTVTFVTGTAMVMIKDYVKYRRQRAVIEAAVHFIKSIQQGEKSWKEKKEDTSSPTKKSDTLPKP